MKVTVEIGGERQQIEIVRRRAAARDGEQGDLLAITRDGETVEVRVVYRDGPYFELEVVGPEGQTAQRLRAAGARDGEQRQLWVNGKSLHYKVVPQGAESAAPAGRGEGGLSASIPAVVSELLVAVGDEVSAGQKLILLESMKMILPILAPHAGVVTAIHCSAGEAVQPGVELVEIGD